MTALEEKSLRQIFTAIALHGILNRETPAFMQGVVPREAGSVAVQIADQAILALRKEIVDV